MKKIGTRTIIEGEKGQITLEKSWNSDISEIKVLGKESKIYKFKNTKNLYSLEIESISNDIIEGKIEATFPGIDKKNIFLNSKMINDWINV